MKQNNLQVSQPPDVDGTVPKPPFSFRMLREHLKNISIKWRIFAAFSVFALLILAVIWLFQSVLFDRFYEQTKRAELTHAAETIQDNLYSPDLRNIIEETARSGQIYAVGVRAVTGKSLFSIDFSPNRFSDVIRPYLLDILQKTVASITK